MQIVSIKRQSAWNVKAFSTGKMRKNIISLSSTDSHRSEWLLNKYSSSLAFNMTLEAGFKYIVRLLQSNLNGSNIFGAMEIRSRYR